MSPSSGTRSLSSEPASTDSVWAVSTGDWPLEQALVSVSRASASPSRPFFTANLLGGGKREGACHLLARGGPRVRSLQVALRLVDLGREGVDRLLHVV